MRPAIFLDRDGTIIEERHYLCDPAGVCLLPNAAAGIRLLADRGYACVVCSNQSGVGRGMYTAADVERVNAELARQLAAEGATIEGWYFCPTPPVSSDRTIIEDPRRKPGPGMLLAAAADLNLHLPESWAIGDMISDLLAGRNAGCRGSILVRTGYGSRLDVPPAEANYVAADLLDAARWIAEQRT